MTSPRKLPEYLIDRNGNDWPISMATAVAMGLPARADALVESAVTRHGWAAVVHKASLLRVRCMPSLMTDKCYRVVSRLIRSSKQRQRILDIPADENGPAFHRIFTIRDDAGYVLAAMVSGRRERSASSFEARPLPLRPIDLELVVKAYMIGQNAALLEDLSRQLDEEIDRPWLLWRRVPGERESVCAAASGRYTPFNPGWYHDAAGRRPSDFADANYGVRISEGHDRVCVTGQAHADAVTAHATLPDTGPTVLKFKRLLIPIERPDGERLVLSTARLEQPEPVA